MSDSNVVPLKQDDEEQMILELVLPKRHPLFSLFNVRALRTDEPLHLDQYVEGTWRGRVKDVQTRGGIAAKREIVWQCEVTEATIETSG